MGQVGMAVAAPRRRADGDEHRPGTRHRARQIAGEAQPPGLDVAAHQVFKPRFIDRNPPGGQRGDLGRIAVHADHFMAEIGQAHARDKADIPRADHRDAHGILRETAAPG